MNKQQADAIARAMTVEANKAAEKAAQKIADKYGDHINSRADLISVLSTAFINGVTYAVEQMAKS